MSEKFEIQNKLTENENYLIWEWFNKVKNQLLNELTKKLKTEKDINKKLLLKEYINNTKLLTSEIIFFSHKENKVNAKNHLKDWKSYKITIYKKNLDYQTKLWLDMLLYHELEHYIWRDKQWKINIDNNTRELNAKILSFKYFMLSNKYDLSINWISELFKKIKREIFSNKNKWKYNLFSQSEETELFWIYEKFKNNKEVLLNYLIILVKLDELKKETKNV